MQAKELAKRTIKDILNADKPVALAASSDELNSLFTLASRALPRLKGRFNVTRIGLLGAMTLQLPENPFGRYLNISVQINPSDSELNIERLKIGQLSISGSMVRYMLRLLLDLSLGDQQGTIFLQSVKSLSLKQDRVLVNFDAGQDIKLRLQKIRQRFKGYRDQIALLGDPEKVGYYYQYLMQLSRVYAGAEKVSLAYYLAPLMTEAYERSATGEAEVENQAAILALAVYLGSYRFESFIGPVLSAQMKAHRPPGAVVLAGRRDLRLHFIFSAALKIISDQGSSIAIGEFKELLDSDASGSGFSFVDLAADRAGIRFAMMATDMSGGAWRLQRTMKNAPESIFFPDISGLPEGLSESEFKTKYKAVNSPEYQMMVDKIDQRLDALPLYRKQPELL